MIEKIEYSYPLDYEDVLQFIPMLTLDNNVKTNGRILHLEISYFKKLLHLFIDTRTKEYCFNTNIEDESNILYEIGDIVLSKYKYFKEDFQELIKYIQKNLTACEVLKNNKKRRILKCLKLELWIELISQNYQSF